MGADGQGIHTRPTRDLADGTVDVVVEDDHEPLLRGQALERNGQLVVEVEVVGHALWDRSG
jgi:hypothetical protein